MTKVVFAHTDLRLNWPGLLRALHGYAGEHGVELTVVEIAGGGSPYAFAGKRGAVDGHREYAAFSSSRGCRAGCVAASG
jgi:hypothetical protein